MRLTNDMLEQYRRHRDEEAFAKLMDHYRPIVTATCRRHLASAADIEDAVQETFVKLARQAESVRGDVGAWLRSVAATTAIDFTRRALRQRRTRQALLREGRLDRRDGLCWRAIQDRLEEGLAGLDCHERSLVVARFFDGMPVRDIASRMRLSRSTVTRRIACATEKLHRALSETGFETLEDAAVAGGLMDPRNGGSSPGPSCVRAFPPGLLWEQTSPPTAEKMSIAPGPAEGGAWRRDHPSWCDGFGAFNRCPNVPGPDAGSGTPAMGHGMAAAEGFPPV